jgi:deoxyribose-phosphate aldolase
VKASGGICDTETAEAMIKAGANRIGTSASVAIVEGAEAGGEGVFSRLIGLFRK